MVEEYGGTVDFKEGSTKQIKLEVTTTPSFAMYFEKKVGYTYSGPIRS